MSASLPPLFLQDLQFLWLTVASPFVLQVLYCGVAISIMAAVALPGIRLYRWLRWKWDHWRAAQGGG